MDQVHETECVDEQVHCEVVELNVDGFGWGAVVRERHDAFKP